MLVSEVCDISVLAHSHSQYQCICISLRIWVQKTECSSKIYSQISSLIQVTSFLSKNHCQYRYSSMWKAVKSWMEGRMATKYPFSSNYAAKLLQTDSPPQSCAMRTTFRVAPHHSNAAILLLDGPLHQMFLHLVREVPEQEQTMSLGCVSSWGSREALCTSLAPKISVGLFPTLTKSIWEMSTLWWGATARRRAHVQPSNDSSNMEKGVKEG